MKSKVIPSILLAVIIGAGAADETAFAAPTNAAPITTALITRLLREVQTNNPSFLAANFRAQAAAANTEATRVWDDPTLVFGGNVFSPRGMDPAQQGDLIYGVQQKLPLWGLPELRRQVASDEMSARAAETNFRFRQLRRDVTKQLLAAALAERVVQIGEQDLAWLQMTATEIETKYQNGQTRLADALEIQNEIAERHDQLQTDRLMLDHAQVGLNRLLNRNFDSPWPSFQLPELFPVVPFSEKLVAAALTNEPQIKILEQEIKTAAAETKLTRRSRLPDVSVGVAGEQYSGDGGFRSGMFTLSFSWPWFNAGKYRKDFQRAQAAQQAAEQDRADQKLTAREALHQLTLDIENSHREALLYRDEISTRAEQMLASRLADWENGHGALRDVLDARRSWLDSQLTAVRANAGEQQDVAELLLWTGLENNEELLAFVHEPPLLLHHHETN